MGQRNRKSTLLRIDTLSLSSLSNEHHGRCDHGNEGHSRNGERGSTVTGVGGATTIGGIIIIIISISALAGWGSHTVGSTGRDLESQLGRNSGGAVGDPRLDSTRHVLGDIDQVSVEIVKGETGVLSGGLAGEG